jgi:putative membrane protein
MLRSSCLLAGVVVVMGLSAPASAAGDQEFLTKAIKGDVSEVALGNLALKKAASPGLKTYAQTLVTDHGAHKQKVEALAKQAGMTPPAEPTPEAQNTYNMLNGLSGAEFDRQFVAHMVEDHEKDIAEYKQEANSGKDQTAALAKQTLPVLEKHLKMAKDLQGKT